MQNWHGLEWTYKPLSTSVNFMDLTISIAGTGLLTTLYKKPQNLYLYLPPHSLHPRGIKTGLILGEVLRIRRLCSKQEDANKHIRQLFQRLCKRGHDSSALTLADHKNCSSTCDTTPKTHLHTRSSNSGDNTSHNLEMNLHSTAWSP
eukprot:CCRYP_001640-RA/>CCRYP_001640-RA protein AED:0.55 eAED:0.55 QI:0/-1/0/1/-1/0/1/0/146